MIEAPEPSAEQSNPYTPAGPTEFLLFEEFEGINTATLRPGVDDKQGAWFDGFMPLARRNLRTMPGVGPSIAVGSVANPLVFFYFANIGATPYAICVMQDGSIKVVNTDTSAVSTIAAGGTITNPGQSTVGMAQYGSTYVIIVARQTNGYFIWDGTTFFSPGGAAPGGGTMPLAINGTAIEIYAGRVWIANGNTITFGAPGSVSDFSSAHGGGNFQSTDSFLRVSFIGLKQTNGFLYLVADSSVNYISGVQTSGTPSVTTFTNQNADPEVGSPYPGTIMVFNRNILFANAFGAQVSYGGAVTKISEMLDGVYNTVPNFGSIALQAAKAIIFGKKCWVLLVPIIDPISGQQVSKFFLWNGKYWWASSQDFSAAVFGASIGIAAQEINSVLTAWGTDLVNIFKLFNRPSSGFTKIAQTKLWDKPGGYQFLKWVTRFWGIVQYYSSLAPTINVSIDNETGSNKNPVVTPTSVVSWVNNLSQVVTWMNNAAQIVSWVAGTPGYSVISATAVAQEGVLTGFTVTTNAADMAIVSMMIHDEIGAYRG
jgi:hypothetical protein